MGRARLRVAVTVSAAILGAALALGVLATRTVRSGASPSPAGTTTVTATPSAAATSAALTRASTAQRKRWPRIGYDRSYKCDLVEKLTSAPDLVVLGGSRAQRFEPSVITRLTGLSAFNFAVQNIRPADAYAISKYLFARAPATKLHCLFAIQATMLVDTPMDQALLYDKRLSQWFPKDLLASQKRAEGAVIARRVPSSAGSMYSGRGCILSNGYDRRLAQGITLAASLQTYLTRMVPRAAARSSAGESLSKFYFRKLLRLYNGHGVTPVIVIMPYHPEALSAFRAVGWEKKLTGLKDYLSKLHGRYDFRVLDYTDIGSFGGKSRWFYDGAHITKENARLILQKAVKSAPECFR